MKHVIRKIEVVLLLLAVIACGNLKAADPDITEVEWAATPKYAEDIKPPSSGAGASAAGVTTMAGATKVDRAATSNKQDAKDVDLDIDSLNDSGMDVPSDDPKEDAKEDDAAWPGKALAINELDWDRDGVPDFADGYDIVFDKIDQSKVDASHWLVPVVLRIPSGIDDEKATITFTGGLSDPESDVTRTDALPYKYDVVSGKRVRLWTKNGTCARKKASVASGGDSIKESTAITVADLKPGTDRNVILHLEALAGSKNLADIVITATLNVGGTTETSSDTIRATVFSIEVVHPIAADFHAGATAAVDEKVGAVMISTKQDTDKDTAYYTKQITTEAGKRAQSSDHSVTISAYVTPIPPKGYPNPRVYFEVTDPDDRSHYEGKIEDGVNGVLKPSDPSQQGDDKPNDNRDPKKKMSWTGEVPDGYEPFQACLTERSAIVKAPVPINKVDRAVAETVLNITDRYAGDNYRVRATMQYPPPHGGGVFDTRSGMTAKAKAVASTVKESETLIAWKRVYIEQDDMYRVGCTITSEFTPDDNADDDTLTVDQNESFNAGNDVVIFWKGGSLSTTISDKPTLTSIKVPDIPNTITGGKIPQWGGIIPVTDSDIPVWKIDRRYLPNAFGAAADGSDGGAFIEFRDMPTGSGKIPCYRKFPDLDTPFSFAEYWFDNAAKRAENVRQLVSAVDIDQSYLSAGVARADLGIAVVFCLRCDISGGSDGDVVRDETAVHEIGHVFDLVRKPFFPHIDDGSENLKAHDNLDWCQMDYAEFEKPPRNYRDGHTEFCYRCLYSGQPDNKGVSLRDREDN